MKERVGQKPAGKFWQLICILQRSRGTLRAAEWELSEHGSGVAHRTEHIFLQGCDGNRLL